jgi:DUF1680 family protein
MDLLNLGMYYTFRLMMVAVICAGAQQVSQAQQQPSQAGQPGYFGLNRAPLRPNPYIELPLGAITPKGWLREMLMRQAKGATGHLDSLYPQVMGVRNGWRGGDGDQWERGPYWLDGLLPLAYILHDQQLIARTKPFIEWTLASQRPDGYFGPDKDYPREPGLQRDNSHDWWPHMVMLKVLQQYYSATRDQRVIRLMTNYFRYQLGRLPAERLDHWTFWARYRAGDNLQAIYWLYNVTGDKWLLDLADLMHRQTFDYTHAFLHSNVLMNYGEMHGVNLAEGMKEPLVYYQQHPEAEYGEATTKAFEDLDRFDGMPFGLFGADEEIHGNDPTQGSELCTAVEMMFTLEQLVRITGQVDYVDRLERVAFNALPTQIDSSCLNRQYFQQANQVMITKHLRNFATDHDGTDVCYGLLTGYACCTSNMHQGWPKLTQNLWYATPDSGLAALVYAPCSVKTMVRGRQVTVEEETGYPFEETIRFKMSVGGGGVAFPLVLRIPGWCLEGEIRVNGGDQQKSPGDTVARIERVWRTGDVVELRLPMYLSARTWHENAVSIERGPLVFALKIGERASWSKDSVYGDYEEIRPATPWNYALEGVDFPHLQQYKIEIRGTGSLYPWTADGAPVILRTKARRLPGWILYNESAGPTPYTYVDNEKVGDEEEIVLIPYGCTRLRISEFPVIER